MELLEQCQQWFEQDEAQKVIDPAYVFHQISSAESKARIFAEIKRRCRYGAIGAMPAVV